MRAEPIALFMEESTRLDESRWCGLAVALATHLGHGLKIDSLESS